MQLTEKMIIRCGENPYQALRAMKIYIPAVNTFHLIFSSPSCPPFPLIKRRNTLKPSTICVKLPEESLLNCFLFSCSQKNTGPYSQLQKYHNGIPYPPWSLCLCFCNLPVKKKETENSQSGSIDNWQMAKGRLN